MWAQELLEIFKQIWKQKEKLSKVWNVISAKENSQSWGEKKR